MKLMCKIVGNMDTSEVNMTTTSCCNSILLHKLLSPRNSYQITNSIMIVDVSALNCWMMNYVLSHPTMSRFLKLIQATN